MTSRDFAIHLSEIVKRTAASSLTDSWNCESFHLANAPITVISRRCVRCQEPRRQVTAKPSNFVNGHVSFTLRCWTHLHTSDLARIDLRRNVTHGLVLSGTMNGIQNGNSQKGLNYKKPLAVRRSSKQLLLGSGYYYYF